MARQHTWVMGCSCCNLELVNRMFYPFFQFFSTYDGFSACISQKTEMARVAGEVATKPAISKRANTGYTRQNHHNYREYMYFHAILRYSNYRDP